MLKISTVSKYVPEKSTDEDHLKKTEPLLLKLGLNLNQITTWKEVDNMKYEGDDRPSS